MIVKNVTVFLPKDAAALLFWRGHQPPSTIKLQDKG